MDPMEALVIINYLNYKRSPEDFTRKEKKALYKKCQSFCMHNDDEGVPRLHYSKNNELRRVIIGETQKQKIISEIHGSSKDYC